MARQDILNRKDDIKQWILETRSKSWMCRQLNCKPSTLDHWLTKMGIQYSGNKGRKGYIRSMERRPVLDYLVKDGPNIQTYRLKQKLIDEGFKEYRCEGCNGTKWLGVPIPLELHHKDGNRHNNQLDNLQVLCPNCHSLTPNNSGKSLKQCRHCLDCGDKVARKSKRCRSCQGKRQVRTITYQQATKIDWPDTEVLAHMVQETSFEAVGRKLGVSGNAVRKRLKNHS